jgi:hypothetical protein
MKKEIKKLQRLRDFFRSNQNNPDIKDKSKLDQGRKMIENEMERFREHEKEFKMKQYSKRALAADFEKKGNFVDRRGGSNSSRSYGSSCDDSYGDEYGGEDYGSEDEHECPEEEEVVSGGNNSEPEPIEIELDDEKNDPM